MSSMSPREGDMLDVEGGRKGTRKGELVGKNSGGVGGTSKGGGGRRRGDGETTGETAEKTTAEKKTGKTRVNGAGVVKKKGAAAVIVKKKAGAGVGVGAKKKAAEKKGVRRQKGASGGADESSDEGNLEDSSPAAPAKRAGKAGKATTKKQQPKAAAAAAAQQQKKKQKQKQEQKKLPARSTPKPAQTPKPAHVPVPHPTPFTLPSHFTKSLWKVRPLQVDEKLRVFIEGRDDGIQRYDGGEFQQWLEDCKAGRGDPLEAGAYPLVVQDSDLRQVLEIKFPSARALGTLEGEYGYMLREEEGGRGAGSGSGSGNVNGKDANKKLKNKGNTKGNKGNKGTAAATASSEAKITIPQWKKLPTREWPDAILDKQTVTMPLLVRTVDGGAEPVERKPPQATVDDEKRGYERAYMRYMMPTPDDWDQAIEYDLDEDDERWLEAYNQRSSKKNGGKASGANPLKEEWLEHLIDRMEKEYTSELQKHPEKWISKRVEGDGGAGEAGVDGGVPLAYMKGQLPPPLILPSIGEMFPLSVCMKVFGLGKDAGVERERETAPASAPSSPRSPSAASFRKGGGGNAGVFNVHQVIDEKIIKDVYNYWKKKHQKAGLPLIQRLWYEPPWHRKASDEDLDGDDETVFSGFDLHPSLARIRKRKMNDDEVQLRFDCLRRDFEQVRTIADLIRRREKLKLQETSILKQEWASRMKDVRRASKSAAAAGQAGTLTFSRPPKLASLVESKRSTLASREHRQDVITEQEQKLAIERTLSEDRAARLAARRDVRAEALRIRRERIATKKSSSKSSNRRRDDRKNRKSKASAKKPGVVGKQPRNSTGQFLSFKERVKLQQEQEG